MIQNNNKRNLLLFNFKKLTTSPSPKKSPIKVAQESSCIIISKEITPKSTEIQIPTHAHEQKEATIVASLIKNFEEVSPRKITSKSSPKLAIIETQSNVSPPIASPARIQDNSCKKKISPNITPKESVSPHASLNTSKTDNTETSEIVVHNVTQALASKESSSGLADTPNDSNLASHSNNTSFELNMSFISTREMTSPSPKTKSPKKKVRNYHTCY